MKFPFRHTLARPWLLFVTSLILLCAHSVACRADLWGLSTPANGTPASGTEANYNKVFRFDNSGNKLANDIPSGSAGLNFPAGIAVGPDGNTYVSSVYTGSVNYYNGQTGAPLPSPIGGPDGLFAFLGTAAPGQLAFGPDGNLYVSEYFGTNVRAYDAHAGANFGAQLANAATGLDSAGGITFLSNGDMLVGNGFVMAEGQTAKITRVHNGVQSDYGYSQGNVYAPASLMALPDDSVLVVDLLANVVTHYDTNGIPSLFAYIPPAVTPPATNFPSDIKLDPDGNLIVSVLGETNPPDNRGALLRYGLDGSSLGTIVDGLEPLAGLAWTPSAATLAGDYDGNGSIGASDYNRWRADFGKAVAKGNGADGNDDGVIDARDYVVWRKAQSAGMGVGSLVPEPDTLVLVIGSLFSAAGLRRRKG